MPGCRAGVLLKRKAWSIHSAPLSVLGLLVCLATPTRASEPSFCTETPSGGAPSLSLGRPSEGHLQGARALESGPSVRLLPLRHVQRCLNFGTERLVQALRRAGEVVERRFPGSPPLGVGDLSKARGGRIFPYSHSHQSGRDADLAFYATDGKGRPVPLDDLLAFGPSGEARGRPLKFDSGRTWMLVRALLEDREITVQWLFISRPLRAALLAEADRSGAPTPLVQRAAQVLHQPSDAPPHADHLHLRITCSEEERRVGCRS